jgi:hypothetical protein
MRSDFDARRLKSAKSVLENDLKAAQDQHEMRREAQEQEKIRKEMSLWSKIKSFFIN